MNIFLSAILTLLFGDSLFFCSPLYHSLFLSFLHIRSYRPSLVSDENSILKYHKIVCIYFVFFLNSLYIFLSAFTLFLLLFFPHSFFTFCLRYVFFFIFILFFNFSKGTRIRRMIIENHVFLREYVTTKDSLTG